MISKLNRAVFVEQLKYWGPILVWMSVIFLASADTNSGMHSSWIIEPICRWLFPHITFEQLNNVHLFARKAAHMTEYALLALLLLRALSHKRGDFREWIFSAWLLSTVYAATDEFHQLFVPSRGPSVTDVMIDSLGAALGLLICLLFLDARAKRARAGENTKARPVSFKARPSFADRLLCTLQGEDSENQTTITFSVPDRLQRENGGRLILGRNGTTAHLCVKNTSISGEHLSLTYRKGRFEIEDLEAGKKYWTPTNITSFTETSVKLMPVAGKVQRVRYNWQMSPCDMKAGILMCAVYARSEELPAMPFILSVTSHQQ